MATLITTDPTAELTEDPEDVLAASLDTLFDHAPITLASSIGSQFVFEIKDIPSVRGLSADAPLKISLRVPDTQASNWSLHASSIWTASVYLADHIDSLHLETYLSASFMNKDTPSINILELGAGAGLPSIAVAKAYHTENIHVVASDYPDEKLISTLEDNVRVNEVDAKCSVVPYAWGADASPLLRHTEGNGSSCSSEASGFDVVIAADTLWNPDTHGVFVDTLKKTLKRNTTSRVHLVAGLHTGRYTIRSLLDLVTREGFNVEVIEERRSNGSGERDWSVDRADGEDEQERRRWLIWAVLKWRSI